MKYLKLNTNDIKMMDKLMPLYFNYESDITNLKIEEMFDVNKRLENKLYFENYFKRGIDTIILESEDKYIGFISFHVESELIPGYAEVFNNYGHLAEIYVINTYGNKGIAAKLVNYFEEVMRKDNINKVYLVDIVHNNKFWEKLNYINTGKIEPNEGGEIYIKILI